MRERTRFNCLFRQVGEVYKLFVYDTISRDGLREESETSAKYVADQLSGIPEGSTLEVHINSDGGDAFEGTAICNQLKAAPLRRIGIVDGHAYSAAAFILMACDERVMNTGTMLLIHNAWTVAVGNAEELRKTADELDAFMEENRKLFLEHCNLTEEELIALMKEDRPLRPEEAKRLGFIDRITDEVAAEEEAQEEQEPVEEPEEEPEEEPAEKPEEEPEEEPEEDDPDENAGEQAKGRSAMYIQRQDRCSVAENYFRKFY